MFYLNGFLLLKELVELFMHKHHRKTFLSIWVYLYSIHVSVTEAKTGGCPFHRKVPHLLPLCHHFYLYLFIHIVSILE